MRFTRFSSLVACGFIGIASASAVDISSDLLIHLPFDGDASNASGASGITVTPSATPSYTTSDISGKSNLGQAVQTTGGVTIDLTSSDDFAGQTDMTVSAWVRGTNKGATFFARGDYGNPKLGWKFDQTSSGTPLIGAELNAWMRLVGSTNLSDGTWHHIALVASYDGTNTTMQVYVDGTSDGSKAIAGPISDLATTIQIGGEAGDDLWTGTMDEFRYYTRALSAAEVTALKDYDGGGSTPVTNINLQALAVSHESVQLTWDDQGLGTGDEYQVLQKDVTGGETEFSLIYTAGPSETSHTVSGLASNNVYEFQVDAVDNP